MHATITHNQGEELPKADLIAGVALAAIGLALLFWIIPMQTQQHTGAAVPPDLGPNICAAGITVLAAILTLQAARAKTPAGEAPHASEWAAMVAVVIVVVAGAELFEYVNPAAGFFVCLAPMLYMGERRWYLLLALPRSALARQSRLSYPSGGAIQTPKERYGLPGVSRQTISDLDRAACCARRGPPSTR